MSDAALPVLLALSAAALFGVSSVVAKRGLAHVNAQLGSLIAIGTTALIFLAGSPLWMRAGDWFTAGFWVFVLNGLIHPLLSMYMALEATARTGPTVAATFSSTAPLFAALTAVVFLGESLNAPLVAGTLATIAGVMAISWTRAGIPVLVRAALAFATGAAIIRGLNHTVGKWGLELLPNVFMAGFVSFSVSFCGAVFLYHWRLGSLPVHVPRAGLFSFVITGAVIALAILCMYSALAAGEVVVVSPIIASYPLFTLLTALLLREERLSARAAGGVLMVVGGVTLISLGSTR